MYHVFVTAYVTAHGPTMACLPMAFGGAKESDIVYFTIKRGAKIPMNPQNHRSVDFPIRWGESISKVDAMVATIPRGHRNLFRRVRFLRPHTRLQVLRALKLRDS